MEAWLGAFIFELNDAKFVAKVDWAKENLKEELEDYFSAYPSEKARYENPDPTAEIPEEEKECFLYNLDAKLPDYLAVKAAGEAYLAGLPEDATDEQKATKGDYVGPYNMPISLFNFGFDVWLNGNRGTLY